MKTRSSLLLAFGFTWLLGANSASADGWSFPSLNPFKTEEKEMTYAPPSISAAEDEEPPTSGFKFPKLKLPSLPKIGSDSPKPRQPSTMQKLGRGTKNFFSKTADVLTPWDNDEKAAPRRRTSTGVRRTYNGSPSAAVAEKKSSWLPSWFSKEEPEQPHTVNGFIAQPRPRF
jgi:hypothetical protein